MMTSLRLAITWSLASSVLVVPAFAQSDRSFASDLSTMGVVRVFVPADAPGATVPIPANLKVPPMYRAYVESMVRWSPTFRRQCLRLANAPWLTVVMERLEAHPSETARARTRFSTDGAGRRTATMAIRSLDDQIELIAHELEHVIEQLDGVDLRARATLPATGVHAGHDDREFETIRAIRAGRAVSKEVRQSAG
jgi:hypothetical protein